MRYAKHWEETVERMGRWIDFENDYKTLYPWFMESVWWVFSELFKKGLVYRGVKVIIISSDTSLFHRILCDAFFYWLLDTTFQLRSRAKL